MQHTESKAKSFSPYQKFVLAMLVFLQFTLILDFMIISPMGAILMPGLHISPAQFGTVVSVYAFAAAVSGVLAAGFADRFDRKRLLLFFYCGFIIGTLLCALANNYQSLFLARLITGFFGGVIGSIVLAIIADLYPFEMRGRVMGFVQTAFSASQVLGIPAGLYFSNLWGWHAPFVMIVVLGIAAGAVIFLNLKPINAHLTEQRKKENPFKHFFETILNRNYTLAFCATVLLSTGGFLMMPFSSDFTVHNLGIDLDHLPMIYLVTGLFSIFTGPLIGKLADVYGKYPTFVFGGILTCIMVLIYTNLGPTPLPWVIVVTILLFTGIFSRMIPAQALMSAVPDPKHRGSFMAVSSAMQQVSGGLAAMAAGLIVSRAPDGRLENFNHAAYVMVGTVTTTVVLMYFLNRKVMRLKQN